MLCVITWDAQHKDSPNGVQCPYDTVRVARSSAHKPRSNVALPRKETCRAELYVVQNCMSCRIVCRAKL